MQWSTACLDWEERITASPQRSLVPVPPLFPVEGAAGLDCFNALRVVDVAGQPTMGQLARPWLTDFVSAVFGAYDPDTGKRLITEFFLLIAKKNTKSTSAAGIMLTALIRNWRHSAEYLILAPTIEVANNSFHPARDMVRADPELSDMMHVQEHVRTITHRITGAQLRVVAADDQTVSGKKATGVLIDELWLFGKRPNAEAMLREATGGLASRPEGFTIYLTTQSPDPPAGVFRQKLLYARGVRDGRINDPRFLPVLYEYPKAMLDEKSYLDPEKFIVTNPNIGASVSREYLERELVKAREEGEVSVLGFAAKHLNVEIGLGLRSDRWAGADYWQVSGTGLTLDQLLQRSDVVTIGIDGGGLDDMLGLAVVGRDEKTGKWLHWAHAWIHPIVLERRKSEASRFKDFEAAGVLTIVDEIGRDIEDVAGVVSKVEGTELLDNIGVDPAGIGAIVQALTTGSKSGEEGKKAGAIVAHDRLVGIPQGWRLTGAIKTTERRLAEGRFEHGSSPLMAWCVANARVEPRGNAILITKQASGSAKIDPLMATFNAVTLMGMDPKPRKRRYQVLVGRV